MQVDRWLVWLVTETAETIELSESTACKTGTAVAAKAQCMQANMDSADKGSTAASRTATGCFLPMWLRSGDNSLPPSLQYCQYKRPRSGSHESERPADHLAPYHLCIGAAQEARGVVEHAVQQRRLLLNQRLADGHASTEARQPQAQRLHDATPHTERRVAG